MKKRSLFLMMAISMLISVGYSQNNLKQKELGLVDMNEVQFLKDAELWELSIIENSGEHTYAPFYQNTKFEKWSNRGIVIASYDFEEGMPEDFELIGEDCGWAIGWGPNGGPNSGGSTYLPIPEHDGKYAYINGTPCGIGDVYDTWMILPQLDFSDYSKPRITYDLYTSHVYQHLGREILSVKVSIDGMETWIDFQSEKVTSANWITSTINLFDFAGEENVYIAFYYDCDGGYALGWAVDNIVIDDPYPHDLLVVDIYPYGGINGVNVIPKVVVKNNGGEDESTWSVTLTDNAGYTSTKTGSLLEIDETITVFMDNWTIPSGGEIILTATIIVADDGNPEDNILEKTISIAESYSSVAFIGNAIAGTYHELDIVTGELTQIGTMSVNPLPRSQEYDGRYVYRLISDGTIVIVYPNMTIEPVGKLKGFQGSIPLSITYDWNNDKWYLIGDDIALYSLDINTLEVTKIADSGLSDPNYIIAFDFAHDGYIYGPCFNGNLYKIDPFTGVFEVVGSIESPGITSLQDVSFDYEHLRLYTFHVRSGTLPLPFGFYNLATGKFEELYDYDDRTTRSPLVILKEPQPFYSLTMTLTDGTEPLEGAEVKIISEDMSISTIYDTNADGQVIPDLTNGNYSYEVRLFGFHPSQGQFTINNSDETVNVVINPLSRYTVTFQITNLNGTNMNAKVSLKYQENVVQEGTAINGKIIFSGVSEGEYNYDIEYSNYITMTNIELNVNEDKTVNVTMLETFGFSPAHLNVTVYESEATLTWVNYVPESLSYWDHDTPNIRYIMANRYWGPGVIFDLSNYKYVQLTDFEFFHLPEITSGVSDYYVHVIDIENDILLYTTEMLQTTGINKWETVDLQNLRDFDGNKIGIFIDCKSLYYGVIPMIVCAGDVTSTTEYSYWFDVEFEEPPSLCTNFTEFLMNLWIITDDGDRVMLGGGDRPLQNFEVFLNDISKGTAAVKTFDFHELANGIYTAGVRAVYETGTTETTYKEFEVTDSNVNIESVKYLFSCYVSNTGLLTVKSDSKNVNLEIISMNGQVVGKSATNSISLPQKGVYAVKANIDGKITNFKVVW